LPWQLASSHASFVASDVVSIVHAASVSIVGASGLGAWMHGSVQTQCVEIESITFVLVVPATVNAIVPEASAAVSRACTKQ
jgi:hypothetical protein